MIAPDLGSRSGPTSEPGPLLPPLIAARRAASETSTPRSRSWATRRAYESGWRRFEAFCAGLELTALLANSATVARFVVRETG